MKLEDKGTILPPPVLSALLQPVSAEIQAWKNIIAATHWDLYDNTKPDGADFYVGKEELGHIHLDGSVHLATDKNICAALLKNKLAKKFPWGGENASWVMFTIKNDADAAFALWLFRLSYDRIIGAPMNEVLNEITGKRLDNGCNTRGLKNHNA